MGPDLKKRFLDKLREESISYYNFVQWSDASHMFPPECPFQHLCNKDQDGMAILTPRVYLDGAFRLAVEFQGVERVRSLLRSNYLLWPEVSQWQHSLMVAAFLGERDLVEWMLNYDQSLVHHRSWMLGTALFAAVFSHKSEIVSDLLRHDANPDATSRYDDLYPLYIAIKDEDLGTIRTFLEFEAVNPDKFGRDKFGRGTDTPLGLACYYGFGDLVEKLLTYQRINPDEPSVRAYGMTPLQAAVMKGQTQVVDMLLKRGDVNPNRCNEEGGELARERPLYIAARDGHIGIVKLLLQRVNIQVDFVSNGQWVGQQNLTPLGAAIEKGHDMIASDLVSYETCDLWEPSIIFVAVQRNMPSLMRALLKRPKVDINARDKNGLTPLIAACRVGDMAVEVVNVLLEFGADTTLTDTNGFGAYTWALAKNPHGEIARLFRRHSQRR